MSRQRTTTKVGITIDDHGLGSWAFRKTQTIKIDIDAMVHEIADAHTRKLKDAIQSQSHSFDPFSIRYRMSKRRNKDKFFVYRGTFASLLQVKKRGDAFYSSGALPDVEYVSVTGARFSMEAIARVLEYGIASRNIKGRPLFRDTGLLFARQELKQIMNKYGVRFRK